MAEESVTIKLAVEGEKDYLNATADCREALDKLQSSLKGLADIGKTALQWAPDFVKENPAVVLAIESVCGALEILGNAVNAVKTIMNLVNSVRALSMALSACPVGLVVAAIAGLVAIISLFIAKNNSASDSVQALTKRLKEQKKAYEENMAAIQGKNKSTQNLVDTLLAELKAEEKNAAQKAIILNLIEQLNAAVPGLGLEYDEATKSINMTTTALKEQTEAATEANKVDEQADNLAKNKKELAELSRTLTDAQERLNEAKQKELEIEKEFDEEIFKDYNKRGEAWHQVDEARRKVVELTEAYDKLNETVSTQTAELEATIEAQKQHEEAVRAAQAPIAAMEEHVESLVAQMNDLQAAYSQSYERAYDSIDQQLGLFKELDGTAKTSVGNLLKTLDGQIKYMDDYAKNIEKAMALGVDKGLVQKLSDGSQESAQILAAIVEDGGENVAELNEKLAQVEQGKDVFASTVAELETDFKKNMALLVCDLESTMNEMQVHDKTFTISMQNIDGLINGAQSRRQALINTYSQMALDALAAYKAIMAQASPSKKMAEAGRFDIDGLISGAKSKRGELAAAYEQIGETAITAMQGALPTRFEGPSSLETQGRTAEIISSALFSALGQATQAAGEANAGDLNLQLNFGTEQVARMMIPAFRRVSGAMGLEVV